MCRLNNLIFVCKCLLIMCLFTVSSRECHSSLWGGLSREDRPHPQELPEAVQLVGGCGGVGTSGHRGDDDPLCQNPVCLAQSGRESSKYNQACLIWHMFNPFSYDIQHWFSCSYSLPFDHLFLFCALYNPTLCVSILTNISRPLHIRLDGFHCIENNGCCLWENISESVCVMLGID